MPTPTTAKWPKPKGEDEFEDLVVDFLRIRWKDPHAARNGRRGQRQHGVDIIGRPPWLKGGIAGAQCKNTERVMLGNLVTEVDKAKGFTGGIGEFLIITSSDRDGALQAEMRELLMRTITPFHVEIIFWADIVADLSQDESLLSKHWKGFGSPRLMQYRPGQLSFWLRNALSQARLTSATSMPLAALLSDAGVLGTNYSFAEMLRLAHQDLTTVEEILECLQAQTLHGLCDEADVARRHNREAAIAALLDHLTSLEQDIRLRKPHAPG